MENKYQIITDCCSDIPLELIEENKIEVLSLSYSIGDVVYEYSKTDTMRLPNFYQAMKDNQRVMTSCINEGHCEEVFRKYLDLGIDVIYLAFSSALSASFSVCERVVSKLVLEYPNNKIYCIDTLAASLGQGSLVLYACEMKNNGSSIDSVKEFVLNERLHICHLFTVNSLQWLYLGGRVKKGTLILSQVLDVKPLMHVDNTGHLTSYGKTIGRKRSLISIARKLSETIENPELQTIYISYADCLSDALFLQNEVSKLISVKNFILGQVDTVVGAHAGPGTVAIFYIGKRDID
jgi:DegV family protein with EDD domain